MSETSIIKMLEYAERNDTFSFGEFLKEYKIIGEDRVRYYVNLINSGDFFCKVGAVPLKENDTAAKLLFSVKDQMHLIDYRNLQQAKADSDSAKNQARASTYIAILAFAATFATGLLAYVQGEKVLNSDINIPSHVMTRVDVIEQQSAQLLQSVNDLLLAVNDINNENSQVIEDISGNVSSLGGELSSGLAEVVQELKKSNLNGKAKGQ